MVWEGRTAFESIHYQFGIAEKNVIELMRTHIKRSSFHMWNTHAAAENKTHTVER
jgi:uncharacterized protein (TIGR03643 family)